MHMFGGTMTESYFGVCWIGGKALVNGDGFFCQT